MKTKPNESIAPQTTETFIPPPPHPGGGQSSPTGRIEVKHTLGLTKREYFAALAMQGIISNWKLKDPDDVCRMSVNLADKLIKALNEERE